MQIFISASLHAQSGIQKSSKAYGIASVYVTTTGFGFEVLLFPPQACNPHYFGAFPNLSKPVF